MKYLLFYKGSYGAVLRGPEMRYASLAYELSRSGHKVCLAGRRGGESVPPAVDFVSVSNVAKLILACFRSDVIVLHGGGGLILFISVLSALLGKKIILDAYVPHWIELETVSAGARRSIKLRFLMKAYFNVLRCLFGCLIFDQVVVANQRQLDLVRGFMSPFLLTKYYSKISILSFGCEMPGGFSKSAGRQLMSECGEYTVSEDDFLIGWLGGGYQWFDLDGMVRLIVPAIIRNKSIKLVFFGVEPERKAEIIEAVEESNRENLLFLPWIDFSERFNYWSGLDLSLVWGMPGYENDYASRTRNFDCMALGLPIIQNYDDEWGRRLIDSGAGCVADELSLADQVFALSRAPERLVQMEAAMRLMASNFQWMQFAATFAQLAERKRLSIIYRLAGLFSFTLVIPSVLIFFIICISEVVRGES